MDYDHLFKLKQHPAWRLLTAEHAPLIISFFDQAFVAPGAHAYTQSELGAKLEKCLIRSNDVEKRNNSVDKNR